MGSGSSELRELRERVAVLEALLHEMLGRRALTGPTEAEIEVAALKAAAAGRAALADAAAVAEEAGLARPRARVRAKSLRGTQDGEV